MSEAKLGKAEHSIVVRLLSADKTKDGKSVCRAAEI